MKCPRFDLHLLLKMVPQQMGKRSFYARNAEDNLLKTLKTIKFQMKMENSRQASS